MDISTGGTGHRQHTDIIIIIIIINSNSNDNSANQHYHLHRHCIYMMNAAVHYMHIVRTYNNNNNKTLHPSPALRALIHCVPGQFCRHDLMLINCSAPVAFIIECYKNPLDTIDNCRFCRQQRSILPVRGAGQINYSCLCNY